MARRTKTGIILLGVMGTLIVMGGCHKKVAPAAPPPPPEAAPPPPAAPVVSLTAEPATVEKGQSVTLSWTSSNATQLDIEPNVGTVQATGSSNVTPDESTTYVLTAKGPGGTETASARVTVTAPAPPPETNKGPEVSEEEILQRELKDAYFDLDKSDIRPDAQQTLTSDADALKANSNVKINIEGHCDERGSEEYNLGLGDRRATAAKSFLVNLGVSADRLNTISYGKDRPQCTEHSEDCWQKNRRAHLTLK
ncbi:MAG TPA: peptidoglycan-associated lipoprotein Pal [Terriglobia bacterium]|nr:peptidoglycan-associated lipoprotein Pal [Terriglobia bacterium]